ncbi:MAG TPA: DUF4118 domain-containing protein, partial [Candidatus Angelobacter sp.]|nr:DUF4118 domain-containing protein [Candidatus Angelobacter sp.]
MLSLRTAVRILACAALLALMVFVYAKVLHVNPTTVAVSFLLVILAVAAAWGLRYSIAMSIAAALCFNFFFLPPVGTLTIADTQNWVALLAFFLTSIIASNLSERARRQTAEAEHRRLDVERLYQFSQQLLIAENILELLKTTPQFVTETFGSNHAALYISAKDQTYRSDPDRQEIPIDALREATRRGTVAIDSTLHTAVAPLRMGARIVGAFGITGEIPSRETLEAIGSLIATAVERARA